IQGATSAVAREREAKALALRKAGWTFDSIGRHLGITRDGALKAYNRALERLPGIANREEMRSLDAARLDQLLRRKWQAARDGDEKAFDHVMRIMERRAKLLGLDERTNPQVTIILKILRQLKALPESDLLDVLGYAGDALPDTLHGLPDGGDRPAAPDSEP